MANDSFNSQIVFILTIGFALAIVLGYFSHRCKLSSILGYLIAGYLIGPYSPGFVANIDIAEQLAEIGVILMMFGVGLHFKWQNFLNVKNIAIPGALGQIVIATCVSALLMHSVGWKWESGIVFGIAIGVASTMVLMRMLLHYQLLQTPQGHISIGWLIVEDIFVVLALLVLPSVASSFNGEEISIRSIALAISMVLGKFFILIVLMFTVGHKIVKFALSKIVRTKSHELFTLAILAFTFVIATGSSLVFGTSIALGAFIAGMIIGQTDIRHQVSVNATPLKDAFVVIFFLSIGMLFNPITIQNNFLLFIAILSIILIIKPLSAFLIAIVLRYPVKTALTAAVALAQIGEFSFILAEGAMSLDILPEVGYDIIVACSLVSIAINPLLFKLIKRSHLTFHRSY